MWSALVQHLGAGCFQEGDRTLAASEVSCGCSGDGGDRAPRRVIGDLYAVDYSRPLGSGSFGTVWGARRRECESAVAVKTLDKRRMRELGVPLSFVHSEVKLMKDCAGCEHVVQLHDFIETPTVCYLVMELCPVGNLDSAFGAEGERPEERRAAHLVRQLLAGLAFVHSRSICHRDVKPQNLLLCNSLPSGEEGPRLKLGDFGVAARVRRGELLTEKLGTPTFMAPEIHLLPDESDGYGRGVDVWASGVVLVFLLAQQYPFIDASGRLLRDQLLRGDLPLWSNGTFADFFPSAFQLIQEVAGIQTDRPSEMARDLVRKLLTPQRSQRLPVEKALLHPWFQEPRGAPPAQLYSSGRVGSRGAEAGLCGLGCERPAALPRLPQLLGQGEPGGAGLAKVEGSSTPRPPVAADMHLYRPEVVINA